MHGEAPKAHSSASGDRKIDIFAPKVSTHAHVKFYPEVERFTTNGDKFGWAKYWRMKFNSPKFSPTTLLHYTVIRTISTLYCS